MRWWCYHQKSSWCSVNCVNWEMSQRGRLGACLRGGWLEVTPYNYGVCNQIRLGHLQFKAILETRLDLAGAKYGSAPSPFPCRSCLHCKGAPLWYISLWHTWDCIGNLSLKLILQPSRLLLLSGEEKPVWWQLRVPLLLCCCKSTFRRFLLLLIQFPGPCTGALVFCPCSLIQCSCPCPFIFSPWALVFCPWALIQCPCPKLPLSLLPPAPAHPQLQHPGGDSGGSGQTRETSIQRLKIDESNQ